MSLAVDVDEPAASIEEASIVVREPTEPIELPQKKTDDSPTGMLFHPHSRGRLLWDVLSMMALVYNIVVVPYRISFDSTEFCPNSLWILEAIIDWFFVCDIILNFFTAYHSVTGELVVRYDMIARVTPSRSTRRSFGPAVSTCSLVMGQRYLPC